MSKVGKAASLAGSVRKKRRPNALRSGEPSQPNPQTATPELFPMFLKLEGKPCLVVGAGRIAESKIESLARCGARVRVVAPQATEAVREAARAGTIAWERRRFRNSDLADIFLVVAGTSSPELHERIFRAAQRAHILCNVVDEPGRCDFYYPAVVRRGPLQIAVSTGGRAPSLAQRLRQELESHFPAEYGEWTEELGRARSRVMAETRSPQKRKELMAKLISARAFDEFRNGVNAARGAKDRV
jgi:precorrin-2 dehydrogenase / sirohydrochlorin ferrochelatase